MNPHHENEKRALSKRIWQTAGTSTILLKYLQRALDNRSSETISAALTYAAAERIDLMKEFVAWVRKQPAHLS